MTVSDRTQRLAAGSARGGFTLTELLVAIAIIGILAGLVFGALAQVRETARVAKTRATIAKINEVVMQQYDEFRHRRVPVDTRGLLPRQAAEVRLWAIRTIMAWEMPDRLSDVVTPANDPNNPVAADESLPWAMPGWTGSPPPPSLTRTALARRYFGQFVQRGLPSPRHSPAELLYLIVTVGSPGSRANFADSEIADTDGDGYMEFVDGWGRPIYFIRCAPAFTDSDMQPVVYRYDRGNDVFLRDSSAETEAVEEDHDPFDPLRVDQFLVDTDPETTDPETWVGAWRLVPLVYSAGPDGEYGIDLQGDTGYLVNWNTWYDTDVGKPTKFKDSGENLGYYSHFDNIHNHNVEGIE